jgi:hypothetical protein
MLASCIQYHELGWKMKHENATNMQNAVLEISKPHHLHPKSHDR